MPVTFSSGSADGDKVCTNVTILLDDIVECEEYFTVELSLNTIGGGISLGNNLTAVTVMDSDGRLTLSSSSEPSLSSLAYTAASFSIPTMAMVTESAKSLEVCIIMTSTPSEAKLAKQVDLILSTLSGTGKLSLN